MFIILLIGKIKIVLKIESYGKATIMKMCDDLSSRLGKESTENLILLIDQKISTDMENILKLMVTKEEFHKAWSATKEDIHKLDKKLESKFGELKTDIGNVKIDIANVKIEVGHIKFELLKWIITLWITNTIMIIGLYLRK